MNSSILTAKPTFKLSVNKIRGGVADIRLRGEFIDRAR
jgi:hypothetical protein